jgi:hypothetical protein
MAICDTFYGVAMKKKRRVEAFIGAYDGKVG